MTKVKFTLKVNGRITECIGSFNTLPELIDYIKELLKESRVKVSIVDIEEVEE